MECIVSIWILNLFVDIDTTTLFRPWKDLYLDRYYNASLYSFSLLGGFGPKRNVPFPIKKWLFYFYSKYYKILQLNILEVSFLLLSRLNGMYQIQWRVAAILPFQFFYYKILQLLYLGNCSKFASCSQMDYKECIVSNQFEEILFH